MKRTLGLVAAVAAVCAAASPAPAAYYYDGGHKVTITVEPSLVAEFSRDEARSAVRRALPGVEQLQAGVGGPRIFRTPAARFSPRTPEGTTTSPVFRQGTSPAGRLMALPGGIIVTFKPDWADTRIRAWADARGFSVQQRLNITGNWYVLKTEPGLAALDAANAVFESHEVVGASPNWWVETVTK